jgi:hypothetical protein
MFFLLLSFLSFRFSHLFFRLLDQAQQAIQSSSLSHLTLIKNAYTRHVLLALKRVGEVNADLVRIPDLLRLLGMATGMPTSHSTTIPMEEREIMKGKNSFSHIERLHGMVYAYGVTVVEVVRRKEFCEFSLFWFPLFVFHPFALFSYPFIHAIRVGAGLAGCSVLAKTALLVTGSVLVGWPV